MPQSDLYRKDGLPVAAAQVVAAQAAQAAKAVVAMVLLPQVRDHLAK